VDKRRLLMNLQQDPAVVGRIFVAEQGS